MSLTLIVVPGRRVDEVYVGVIEVDGVEETGSFGVVEAEALALKVRP